MIRQIVGTLGSKVIATVFAFFIVILNTRLLGAEGQGTIALINLALAISLGINNFIGGGAVVYLVPRIEISKLAVPVYLWAGMISVLFYLTLLFWQIFPADYVVHLALLSFLHSAFLFNAQIQLGKLNIKVYNILVLFQVGSLLAVLLAYYLLLDRVEIISYLYALYFSFGLSFLLSALAAIKYFDSPVQIKTWKSAGLELWKYGKHTQFANLIHLLNKRVSYLFLDTLFPAGRSGVGIFSVGTQLSESVWIAASSLATVQYGHISNSSNQKLNKELSLLLFKIALISSVIGTLVLISIPDHFFQLIFGPEITNLHPIILLLSPGIVAISCDSILAHHFSGTGRQYLGTQATLIALGVMVASNLILIPLMGMNGAALATSLAFITQTIFHVAMFVKQDGAKPSEFLIQKKDIIQAKAIVQRMIQNVRSN